MTTNEDRAEAEELKFFIRSASAEGEPVGVPAPYLKLLNTSDIPDGVMIEVGQIKDGVRHLDWNGRLYCESGSIRGEADYTWTRKYWYAPLGMEYYLDLIRRGIEVRQAQRGDVSLSHFEDDGAFISLTFEIRTTEQNLGAAYEAIKAVCHEIEETPNAISDDIGKRVADAARRLSGLFQTDIGQLLSRVETSKSPDDKGRSLEELISRLFEKIPGFSVVGRVRTKTEEIDIEILNDSMDPRFRRESAILLAECKNWTERCGKNEFVLFKEKIENRSDRCSLGFLISWNGFKTTITKEMLRGSRERTLVVPISGADVRKAIATAAFDTVIAECWRQAVNT
ncbi:MAG: hypothetical protein JRF53_16925 [Deltaproteobacteria bacterium]|nr:hypothetical protein [Deltaproteobacteria bacterium]